MNGVHFRTDNNVAPGFMTKKLLNGKDNSGRADRDVFAVGMIVTVRHGVADNNALEIEYRDNLQGPVAKMIPGVDNVLEILGQTVVVDNAAVFASLRQKDVVEVSGFADNAGRIRAAHLISLPPPLPPPAQEFEVKGFVSGSSLTGFRLGPLPDGSGVTVAISYGPAAVADLPGGPANGMYVEVVTTNPEPVGGVLTAARIVEACCADGISGARRGRPRRIGHRSSQRFREDLVVCRGREADPDGRRNGFHRALACGNSTQHETAGPGNGSGRDSLRRQHNFPVGKRTATLRTAKCVERRNNDERTIKEEESAMRTSDRTFRNVTCLVLTLMISVALAACGGGGGGGSATTPGASGPATVSVSIASAPAFPAGTTFGTSTASPVTAAPPANSPSFDNVFVTVTKIALLPSTGPEFPDPNGELADSSADRARDS